MDPENNPRAAPAYFTVVWSLKGRALDPMPVVLCGLPQAPIPKGVKPHYPWRKLAVGSFFFIPRSRFASREKMWNSLTSCKSNAERATGWKFRLEKVVGGIRWIRVR